VNVARLASFADNARPHALAGTAEVMVDGSNGKQGGNRKVVCIDALVAENEDPIAFVDGFFRSLAEFLNSRRKSFSS